MVGAFGVPKLATGVVLAALTAIVIFGGIRQIATVAEYVVPFMAGGYLLVGAVARFVGQMQLPGVLPVVGAATVLIAAALVASLMPAARASRVDVMQALRSE